MHHFKRLLSFTLAFVLLINTFSFQSAFAAEDTYSPDNSAKADPLGSTKGLGHNLHIGEFSGTALYDYPIALPPGRNGLTPSIQISYNSQDSSLDNILGYQWNLNTYFIKRANKKGVEKLYSEKDFVASTPVGAGELIATQLTNGQYGHYGQKTDNSFAKYEYKDDGSWLVTDKQGTQYKFGSTDEGRQFDPDDSSRIYQWMLTEIRDRNDNFIRYTYFKDNGQIYPKTIHYTGHGADDGIFEVRFLPFANDETGSLRDDYYISYASGFSVGTYLLIDSIEIVADGNLRRKYDINHKQIDPLVKNTIDAITETGFDISGNATSLPSATFDYTPSNVRWQEATDYIPNWIFEDCYYECTGAKNILEWDMTGDGLTDYEFFIGHTPLRAVNDGKGDWIYTDSKYLGNSPAYDNAIPSMNRKPIDFDGDARTDVVQSAIYQQNYGVKLSSNIRLNSGQSFRDTIDIGFSWPELLKHDNGAAISDLNGDGLADVMQSRRYYQSDTIKETCLNTGGDACELTDLWEAPEIIISDTQHDQRPGRQVYVQDCNSDGLADVYYAGSGAKRWINDGRGGFIERGAVQCYFTPRETNTQRSADVNGDGLIDFIRSYTIITYSGQSITNDVVLRTGGVSKTYKNIFPINFGNLYGGWNQDSGVRMVDLNGDLLPDIIQSLRTGDTKTGLHEITKKVWMNKGSRPYFLKTIHTSQGGQIDLEYKTSAQYLKEDGTQANPNLPIVTTTISKMTTRDGMGNSSTINYFYEDGHYHYNSVYDREMAGFRVVTKTDNLGYKTKTHYHQGENSVADSDNGEFYDHISKKGMAYRTEAYDNQGRLVQATINRHEKQPLGNGRFHSRLKRSVSVDYNPASGNNRAIAKIFEYDAYGNPTLITDYGEVQLLAEDGTFSDIGNDLIKQINTFTQNTTNYLIGFPIEQKMFDQSNNLLNHQKTYYDNLTLGEVTVGNPTRSEAWLNTDGSFIASTTEYNEFGMPTAQTNPRGYTGFMDYDTHNLYPISQTNPLGHVVTSSYDVGTGDLLQSTDVNGGVTKNHYDGLGRLTKAEITDPKTGSLVTSQTIDYTDTGMPRSVHQTSHNDDSTRLEAYSYLDGLGRNIETKQKVLNGKWVATQTIYGQRGNVKKSIQAYESGASAFDSLSWSKLGTSFTYDAFNRATSATNPLGTTTTNYGLWAQTVTDPNNKKRDFTYDARGQLIETAEHLGADIHLTNYDYSPSGNLIKITDAMGNVKDFTYNSLGKRLTQTDTYLPGQPHGLWQYQYDENGNLTKRIDPLNQIVLFTFDPLNRMSQEDFTGGDGVEFTYIYDQGQNAIGRLSSVTGSNYQHNYEYDLLGRVLRDQRQIDGRDFLFSYDYDLMGGVKKMTYPDDMEVFYDYDGVHQLSKVYSDGKIYADQFDYTPLGQMSEIHLGNNVITTNTHDPNEMYRLTQKQSMLHGVVRLQDFQYSYDALGNLEQLVDESSATTSKTVDYLYDDLYRLMEARYTNTGNYEFVTMNYQYDPIGNMVFKSDVGSFEYNHRSPHAVTKVGDRQFQYDDNGNMIDHNGNVLTYDYRNRLIQSSDGSDYFYDEKAQRIRKNDRYYPNKFYEIDSDKETKFIFAGNQKIAKVSRSLIAPPTVDPIEGLIEGPVEDPSIVFSGTKETDLALWVNGVELLPAGLETEWEYSSDLMIGDNIFEFYTKKGPDAASKHISKTISYTVPIPIVEPVASPVTSAHITLRGTRRANTSLWLNDQEIIPFNDVTDWSYEVSLQTEQNSLQLYAKDRLNQAGDAIQLNVTYFATPPTVDAFEQPVKANPLLISGTKLAGMGIWINGWEVVPVSDESRWQDSLTLSEGINQFTVTAKNEFGVESNGVILTIPYDVDAPTIDPIASPTNEIMVTLSGSKRAYTSVWINGEEVIPVNAEEFWGYTVELTDLHNEFIIITKDDEGLESEFITITIDYDAVPPIVDMVQPTVSSNPHMFSGTKVAGAGIWINGKEVVPPDDLTVWIVGMALSEGENHFEIVSRSKFGVESEPVSVDLTYVPAPSSPGSSSSYINNGSGGGHSIPEVNTLLFRRFEEKEAQEELLKALHLKVKPKEVNLDDPKVVADIILHTQSGNKYNTPKTLWPTEESKTGVEFKNLQITYRGKKATLKWDKMSKEVAKFEIYRSKKPYPHRLSKHASQKIGEMNASRFKNIFEDKEIENGGKYAYRITALNHNGDIIKSSIQLNAEQIFIAQKAGSKVDFSKYTDKSFDKIYISKHNHLEFENTNDPKKISIKPNDGFQKGTKIQVRFISCSDKKGEKEYCEKTDQKIFDVYTIRKPAFANRAKSIAAKIIDLIVPNTRAIGPQPEEKIYYYLSDHLGSTDVVLDENGDVTQRKDYLPFGNERLTVEPNGSFDENYRFTGKELDEETGLYYYGARYYDPLIGRFTSLDPWEGSLSNPQTLNKYAYVLNNPLKYVDPTGMYNIKSGEVEKGDTLSAITSELNDYYGTKYNYNDIAKFNNISNPDKINVGGTVKMGAYNNDGSTWLRSYDSNEVTTDYWGGLNRNQQKITHYGRNFFQSYLPPKAPTKSPMWKKTPGKAIAHNLAGEKGNVDYRGQKLKVGHQAIYNSNNNLVTSEENKGTFDFRTPGSIEHYTLDIKPWLIYGNSPRDTTSYQERTDAIGQKTITSYEFLIGEN